MFSQLTIQIESFAIIVSGHAKSCSEDAQLYDHNQGICAPWVGPTFFVTFGMLHIWVLASSVPPTGTWCPMLPLCYMVLCSSISCRFISVRICGIKVLKAILEVATDHGSNIANQILVHSLMWATFPLGWWCSMSVALIYACSSSCKSSTQLCLKSAWV